jgi:TolB protein
MKTISYRHSLILSLLLVAAILSGCAQRTAAPSAPTHDIDPKATAEVSTPELPVVSNGAGDRLGPFILSIREGLVAHLFLFRSDTGLVRLTDGQWDDIAPALSPDGDQVAFASRRNGYFNLYLLNLQTGETRRLTDTLNYDSSPSWSPDGRWLAFETYLDDNLEIAIMPVDGSQPPIRLTDNRGVADHSPAWAPEGRIVAFVSTRSGDSEIWLADLDKPGDDRFTNLSRTPLASDQHPAWSPDGRFLAWGSETYGPSPRENGVYIWDSNHPDRPAQRAGDGSWPAWSPDGKSLLAGVSGANQEYLTAYDLDGTLLLLPFNLPGEIRGLIWPSIAIPDPLPQAFDTAAERTATPLWAPAVTPIAEGPQGRWAIVNLNDVQAPYPRLHDLVDEAYGALRSEVIQEAGWDTLANLQNAFVPLSTPLDPGMGQDWLYTGRAFAINPITLSAGWMSVTRQDIGPQTYWSLYLRAQAQDGSHGEPLHDLPWDLNARYNLDPQAYDQGGRLAKSVPIGYWIDFSTLAGQYGWERLPALANWRTYFNGTRFTEFAMPNGLDWYTAMLEIYPPEVLITPTIVASPTITPTVTRTPVPWYTATQTPTETFTPTPYPTFTAAP